MKNKIEDKYLYLPLVIMGLYFILRLINQSKLLYTFPLEKINDIAPYMTLLHFLKEYGYHQIIPYWQGGFVLFQFYPPGWFYFALPLYSLTKDVLVTTFVSLIVIFALIFLTIFYFGRKFRMSIVKRIVFFLFLFGNPIAIGNFIRLTRIVELFGWMFFIFLAFICLMYKDRKLDSLFIFSVIISYFALMLSHPAIMIITPIVFISLFLVKNFKEKIVLSLTVILSLILSSFWWFFSFIRNLSQSSVGSEIITENLFKFNKWWIWTSFASIVISIIFFVTFYYYWLSKNKDKKELLFFSPLLVLNLLFVTKLIMFIPYFNQVYPDAYIIMFLFFSIFCFLSSNYSFKIKKFLGLLLIIGVVVSVGISHVKTPYFDGRLDVQKELIEVIKLVDGKFIVPAQMYVKVDSPNLYMRINSRKAYSPLADNAIYDYGIIYHNLDTASTSQILGSTSQEYLDAISKTSASFHGENCSEFKKYLGLLNITNIITFNDFYKNYCDFLRKCEMREVAQKEHVCLFKV